MSPLVALHDRLARFRLQRRHVRWGIAWSAFGITALAVLGVLLAADVLFRLSILQRIVVQAIALAVIGWGTIRFVRPWLGIHETETDVALFVERHQAIDSDLVAALQFDTGAAAEWGSRDLQQAVIQRVAEFGQQLDLSLGMDYRPLRQRLRLLLAVILVWVVIGVVCPRHATVFLHRLLLSNRHYPSATAVDQFLINGQSVWQAGETQTRPANVRSGKNRPVTFIIQAGGKIPDSGTLDCRSLSTGALRRVPLRLVSADDLAKSQVAAPLPSPAVPPVYFLAEIPRLIEPFTYELRLGDFWTDPARVEVIEPPVLELAVVVTPPDYAAAAGPPPASGRQLAVLEGSRVGLELTCINQKPLASASARLTVAGESQSVPLIQAAGDPTRWSLPDRTPLAKVASEIRYEIQGVDRDGLPSESPLQGVVRLKVDRSPSVTVTTVHRVVLPGAKPVIDFRVSDDFGISSAKLSVQIERTPSSSGDGTEKPVESLELEIPLDPAPLMGQNLPYRGRFPLDLAPFHLTPGDHLRLTLAATDYRGPTAGRTESAEPLLIQIADEAGVLSAISEADDRLDKTLDEVIRQQLGVGKQP